MYCRYVVLHFVSFDLMYRFVKCFEMFILILNYILLFPINCFYFMKQNKFKLLSNFSSVFKLICSPLYCILPFFLIKLNRVI
jgi:hypothetical protein